MNSSVWSAFFDELEKIADVQSALRAESPANIGNLAAVGGAQPRLNMGTWGEQRSAIRSTVPKGQRAGAALGWLNSNPGAGGGTNAWLKRTGRLTKLLGRH